ncbi:MAG: hypothetical protein AAF721_11280 [Myxococcota bacterium]
MTTPMQVLLPVLAALLVPGASQVQAQRTAAAPSSATIESVSLASPKFEAYVSEEGPASTCGTGEAVTGFRCLGSYCDNVALQCSAVAGLGDSKWSRWFSEEGAPTRDRYACAADSVMTGVTCSGNYCDNLSLECTKTSQTLSGCKWGAKKYSEEQGPLLLPAGKVVRGVVCSGSYCDNKQFLTCDIH